MLKLDKLSKKLGNFKMKDISLTIKKGDYFVIVGPSGAGKTILLETIAGLHRPDQGKITLNGKDITNTSIQSRSVGLVYQDQALFPHMKVAQNIEYGLKATGTPKHNAKQLAADYAEKVGATHLLTQMPKTLSGGEAQRIALARTLITKPDCLLLDEPISALDATSRHEIQALLQSIHKKGQTTIHITHDYSEALTLATQVAVMINGQIHQTGTPQQIFENPNSKFVSDFIGAKNFFKGNTK
jgi:ABC-type Fe3+/spermidine/putrescine transport system ATPase subunit